MCDRSRWLGTKARLAAAMLASAAVLVLSSALCAETRIELGIGDSRGRIRRDIPQLAPYLAEIEKQLREADQLDQEGAKAAEECRLRPQHDELLCDDLAWPAAIDMLGFII